MLTQRNFAQKFLMWRRWNYKHQAVPDWEKEFYLMLKTRKYFPCTSWVVGSFGRGYEPYRMQSLWQVLVAPTTITPSDVSNVFCQTDHIGCPSISRKEWFNHRWQVPAGQDHSLDVPGTSNLHKAMTKIQELNEEQIKVFLFATFLCNYPFYSRHITLDGFYIEVNVLVLSCTNAVQFVL